MKIKLVICLLSIVSILSNVSNSFASEKIQIKEEYYNYIVEASKNYGVPKEYLIATMLTENRQMNPHAVNKNKNGTVDKGLMQINSVHNKSLRTLGLNINNPRDNIFYSAIVIKRGIELYGNKKHLVFMTYNMGEGGARKAINSGIYSTKYSRKVVGYINNIDNIIIVENTKASNVINSRTGKISNKSEKENNKYNENTNDKELKTKDKNIDYLDEGAINEIESIGDLIFEEIKESVVFGVENNENNEIIAEEIPEIIFEENTN